MSQDQKFIDDAVKEALAAIEPTVRAAITKAVESAGERTRNAIAQAQRALSGVMDSAPEPSTRTAELKRSTRQRYVVTSVPLSVVLAPRANGGYSGIVLALRRSLDDIGRTDRGVGIDTIRRHIEARGYEPVKVTNQQLRSAMSGLLESHEAQRVDRGLYSAGPTLPRQSREAA